MIYRFIYRNFATCSTAVEPYRAVEKALPLGELSPKVTERARTLAEKRRRGDSIALTKRQLIAARRLLGDGLALSVIASQCHLSHRERHWQVGQASLRTTSQSASQTAPLVGEPLAKRQGFPVCQGLPSIGEVARRRRDGEVFPRAGAKNPPRASAPRGIFFSPASPSLSRTVCGAAPSDTWGF